MAVPPPAAVPARPGRDVRLDLVRGWLQLSIFVSHSHGSWAALWLIHGVWGQSDSSEQFVFLSGLVLGSVFARKQLRDGWGDASRDMLRRAFGLWRTDLVTLLLFGAVVLATDRWLPGQAVDYGWRFLRESPVRAVLGLVTLTYQPAYLDALSVFTWSMLALPAVAWAMGRVGALALLPSAGLWAAAQCGWLAAPDLSGITPPAFDIFAWQGLFMLGAWLGRRKLLCGVAVPYRRWLLPMAVAVLMAGLVLRLSEHGLVPLTLPHWGLRFEDKAALSPPRLVHALCLAYVVSRLAPMQAQWMRTAPMRWLAAIGRNSLQVFCAGLFLSYFATLAFELLPGARPWLEPLVITGGIAGLAGYARWLDRAR